MLCLKRHLAVVAASFAMVLACGGSSTSSRSSASGGAAGNAGSSGSSGSAAGGAAGTGGLAGTGGSAGTGGAAASAGIAGSDTGGTGGTAAAGGAAGSAGTGGGPSTYTVDVADTVILPTPGVVGLDVTLADVSDLDGDVDVSLTELPTGVTAEPITLSGPDWSGTLLLEASALATPGDEAEATLTLDGPGDADDVVTITVSLVGPPGVVDLTFGTNGVATHNVSSGLTPLGARMLDDDSTVVGGVSETGNGLVLRFFGTGVLDSSYGSNGSTSVGAPDNQWFDFDVHPDGSSAFALRHSVGVGEWAISIVRVTSDGDADSAFGTDGWDEIGSSPSPSGEVGLLGIQPDGKIVITEGGMPTFSARRRLSTGGQDPEWTNSSVGMLDYTAFAVDASDNILLGAGYGGFAVTRLTPSGPTDTTFGIADAGAGTQVVVAQYPDAASTVRDIVPVGTRIYLLGTVEPNDTGGGYGSVAGLAACTGAGQIDTTFGTGGQTDLLRATPTAQETSGDVLLLHDGALYVLGITSELSTTSVYVARYTLDGTLDAAFGSEGVSVLSLGTGTATGVALGVQNSGRLLAVVVHDDSVRMIRFWL